MKANKVVLFHTPEGRARLKRSRYQKAFYTLAPNFQPQANPFCCGAACAVIVLNALRPTVSPVFAQDTILNNETDAIKSRRYLTPWARGNPRAGVTLEELGLIFGCFSAEAKVVRADLGVKAFRAALKRALNRSDRFIVVNFNYSGLFQTGAGHFSPVAAYDVRSDSVLVLEVANYRNSWYWAPTEQLYEAMAARDADSRLPRGYLVIANR